MNQTVFNVIVTIAVVCIAITLAFSVYQAQEPPVENSPAQALELQQQVELLTQKVVVLGARQPDEKALFGEIMELRARIHSIQQQLDQAPLRPQNSTQKRTSPGAHHESTVI